MENLEEFEKLVTDLHKLSRQKLTKTFTLEQKLIDIEQKFKEIASYLMNKLCMNVSGKKYRIIECEFYYNDGKMHQDPYLYDSNKNEEYFCRDQQIETLHWFFHADVGIDLTIGNGKTIRGGILIRRVSLLDNTVKKCNKLSTPRNLYDRIMNLGNNYATNDNNIGFFMNLEPYNIEKNDEFIQSFRINLSKTKIKEEIKNSSSQLYYKRNYRYAIKALENDNEYIIITNISRHKTELIENEINIKEYNDANK